jgi:hypothetical protein
MTFPKRIAARTQEASNLVPIIVGLVSGNLIIIVIYALIGLPHLPQPHKLGFSVVMDH